MEKRKSQAGFTVIEILIVTVVISTLFIGIANAFTNVSRTYALTRQLNEMYAVLSSCPEIDRALQYDSISGTTNCFPNNVFRGEGISGSTITYTPTLSVTPSDQLNILDPLYNIPDSKVIDISVSNPVSNAQPWQIRLLVARNGIGQQ